MGGGGVASKHAHQKSTVCASTVENLDFNNLNKNKRTKTNLSTVKYLDFNNLKNWKRTNKKPTFVK
jgi:hypothetical protein